MSLTEQIRDLIKHEEEISDTGDLARALDAVLELWRDPQAIAERPLPEGEVAQATWHWNAGHAKGIDDAVRAIAIALGIEASA